MKNVLVSLWSLLTDCDHPAGSAVAEAILDEAVFTEPPVPDVPVAVAQRPVQRRVRIALEPRQVNPLLASQDSDIECGEVRPPVDPAERGEVLGPFRGVVIGVIKPLLGVAQETRQSRGCQRAADALRPALEAAHADGCPRAPLRVPVPPDGERGGEQLCPVLADPLL